MALSCEFQSLELTASEESRGLPPTLDDALSFDAYQYDHVFP